MNKKLLLTSLSLLLFINTFAARIFVDIDATGANNGSSWEDAYTTIEDALAAAIIGDEIWVRAGVYLPASASGFNIPSGVEFYGGFAGTETTLEERDLTVNTTTLHGDIGTPNVDSDNANHVIFLSNVSNQTRVDGFRVINGNANDVSNGSKGGGLYNLNGSPTIANCSFISNISADFGGGITSESGNIRIEDCIITNNTADDQGGGLYLSQSGTAVVLRTIINRNTCVFGDGGGVSTGNGVSSLTIDRSEISGNTAQDLAGAIRLGDDTDFSMYNSIILGNIADANSIFADTTFNEGVHEIINCTFSGNISESSASTSAIVRVPTSTDIINCIFWDNDSNGEVYRLGAGVADPTVDYTIIEGGYGTGSNNINENPLFISPGNPSLAPFTLEDGYDYSFMNSSSPAYEAGDNSFVSSTFNLDFVGNDRIINPTVDLGAYENEQSLSVEDQQLEDVLLYYNPSLKNIEFPNLISPNQYSEISVEIINLAGQLVYNKNEVREDFVNINLSTKGIYIVKLIDSNNNLIVARKMLLK